MTLQALTARATVVAHGSVSGMSTTIEPVTPISNATCFAGASIFPHIADVGEMQGRVADVIAAIQEDWLKVAPGSGYRLTDAAKAHGDLEGRRTEGKLYLHNSHSIADLIFDEA